MSAFRSGYVELQVSTNFSFLRGASHPEELVTAAAALGLKALAITDRNSLAGVVRAHVAAKSQGLRLVVGARLVPRDGPELLCYPQDRAAYGRLCRLLTLQLVKRHASELGEISRDERKDAGRKEGQHPCRKGSDYSNNSEFHNKRDL